MIRILVENMDKMNRENIESFELFVLIYQMNNCCTVEFLEKTRPNWRQTCIPLIQKDLVTISMNGFGSHLLHLREYSTLTIVASKIKPLSIVELNTNICDFLVSILDIEYNDEEDFIIKNI